MTLAASTNERWRPLPTRRPTPTSPRSPRRLRSSGAIPTSPPPSTPPRALAARRSRATPSIVLPIRARTPTPTSTAPPIPTWSSVSQRGILRVVAGVGVGLGELGDFVAELLVRDELTNDFPEAGIGE